MKGHKSSPFRFVTSSRRGEYSVWRGDEPLGFIARIAYRYRNETIRAGWTPTTLDRRELARQPTREAAAEALWQARLR